MASKPSLIDRRPMSKLSRSPPASNASTMRPHSRYSVSTSSRILIACESLSADCPFFASQHQRFRATSEMINSAAAVKMSESARRLCNENDHQLHNVPHSIASTAKFRRIK